MTAVPIRPKDAPGRISLADSDVITCDGASGVGAVTYERLRMQMVGGITGGLRYLGVVAGNAVPATSGAAGDYYQISEAGSAQGKTWGVGDQAIYRGPAGNWDQLRAGRTLNVKDYGALGDGVTNDSGPIQNAVNALGASGGEVFFPPGTYLCDDIELPSRATLRGASRESVTLKMTAAGTYIVSVNSGSAGTANPADNKFGVQLRGITFTGRAVEDGFFQFKYLVNLNAVTAFAISDCAFTAFQGDGIYIGSGNSAGLERHNLNGVIERCNFDGTNNLNRNAISVIDITGLRVRDCFFDRCSKTDMPGCFDAEPDAAYGIVRDVEISGCRIKRCQGQIIIGANMHASGNFYGFSVHDNFFESDNGALATAVGVIGATSTTVDTATPSMGVSIQNNRIESPFVGLLLYKVSGADIEGNTSRNSGAWLMGDYTDTTKNVCNVKISGNRAVNTGSFGGWVICGRVEQLTFEGNEVDAPPNNDALAFVSFLGAHTGGAVSFTRNRFRKGTTNATKTVNVDTAGGYSFASAASNVWLMNSTDVPLTNQLPFGLREFRELNLISYDTTKLPDSFTLPCEDSVVNGDTALPSLFKQGLLRTLRFIDNGDAGYRPFTIQFFFPANNPINSMAQGLPGFYLRHPKVGSNTWDKWHAAADGAIETKSANYTLTPNDETIVFLTTPHTATLPDAAQNYAKSFTIMNGAVSGNIIVQSFDGVQVINFSPSATLTSAQAIRLKSDGSRWWVIG